MKNFQRMEVEVEDLRSVAPFDINYKRCFDSLQNYECIIENTNEAKQTKVTLLTLHDV